MNQLEVSIFFLFNLLFLCYIFLVYFHIKIFSIKCTHRNSELDKINNRIHIPNIIENFTLPSVSRMVEEKFIDALDMSIRERFGMIMYNNTKCIVVMCNNT